MLAHQYDQMGRTDEAEAAYKRGWAINPSYLQKVPEYAAFLVKVRKPEDALAVIESVKDDANSRFQYHLVRGRALLGLQRYDEAVQSLLAGNRIYNSDAGLLAALGTGYLRLGQKEKALEALRASLKLNRISRRSRSSSGRSKAKDGPEIRAPVARVLRRDQRRRRPVALRHLGQVYRGHPQGRRHRRRQARVP